MIGVGSTSNQTLCDRAARDTIGFHPLPQLAGESVNEFCLPRLRLDRGQRETPLPVIMIPDGDPLFGRVSLDDLRTNRKNGEEKAENRVAGN
jgi:hypothetical protein